MYDGLIDNKNAEIWDEQTTINLFSGLCDKARQGDSYLLIHAIDGVITLDQYEYLRVKNKDNKTVSQLIKDLLNICELNLTKQMIQGTIKETASIFLLKCKYGYQDKQVVEVEHKGSVSVNFNFPTLDQNE